MDPFKTPGAVSWQELVTTDVAAAKQFYAEIFGWQSEEMAMPGMTYTVIKVADAPIGGIVERPADYPAEAPKRRTAGAPMLP